MNKVEKFNNIHKQFEEMCNWMKSQDWFTSQWISKVNLNKNNQPYLTTRMKHWNQGIHFESWVTGADLERSTIPIAFHFESSKEATGFRRGEFYSEVLEQGNEIISNLDGYTVSPKSFQLLVKRAPFQAGRLLEKMQSEYYWIPRLAIIIDRVMKNLST